MQTLRSVLIASGVLAVASNGGRHLFSQAPGPPACNQVAGLMGTWRLVEFWDRTTATSPLVYRYGQRPTGYFTYDATGHLSIQIMRGPDPFQVDSSRGEQWFASATPDELRRAAEDYRAYFGTYVVDATRGVVVHRVEGDSRGLYAGTQQRRQYRLVGDTLFIGNDTTTRRVLVRVR